jgi:hypothetical protein
MDFMVAKHREIVLGLWVFVYLFLYCSFVVPLVARFAFCQKTDVSFLGSKNWRFSPENWRQFFAVI